MSSIRQDLVQNAVKFLSDPKVQEAPLAKRISFLESKGMTPEEIEAALDQVKGGNPPPLPPKQVSPTRNWKDISVGMVGVAGAGYGLYYLAQRYLIPYFNFPTAASIDQDTKAIESQLVNSSQTLSQVTAQTQDLIQGMELHAKQVTGSLKEMNQLLETLQKNDRDRLEEIHIIKEEVDELRRMFPKLVEKNQQNQQQMIQEVQAELKSLKSLMVRRVPYDTNGSVPPSAVPITEKFAGITIGNPTLPAWQLEAAKKMSSAIQSETKVADVVDNQDPKNSEEDISDTDTAIFVGKQE